MGRKFPFFKKGKYKKIIYLLNNKPKLLLSCFKSSKMRFLIIDLIFFLVFVMLISSSSWDYTMTTFNQPTASVASSDPKRISVAGSVPQFEIRFKNIQMGCWMEFDNKCPIKTTLIILSMTRRDAFENRMVIRQTWMKDSIPGEVIRFLIADPSQNETANEQQGLEAEQKQHGDLVFLHGFGDTYKHLHLKWYGALLWQQRFCADAEWVMKADDDTAVHLRRMAYWTDKKFRQNVTDHPLSFIGFPGLPNVVRDPNIKWEKWFVSLEMYPKETYPPFVRGGAYLTTSATVRAIMAHTAEIVAFHLDDVVYTGILAELANATVLGQKMHFLHSDYENLLINFGTHNQCDCVYTADDEHCDCAYICMDGVPTLFAIYHDGNQQEIAKNYEYLKNFPCTN